VLPMASVKSDSGKLQTDSSPRERRYTMRYPFSADAEILSLKSGTRVGGVTSDLSLGGCFVCTRLSLEIGTRIRLTLKRKNQTVTMLAVVRVAKAGTGMGLEFLEVAPDSGETLQGWIAGIRESR
jgi:PilZ domain